MSDPTRSEALRAKLFSIIEDLFGFRREQLERVGSLGDLPGWDSLNQVRLIAGIEDEFGVAFEPEELPALDSFDALVAFLERRVPGSA